MRLVDNEEGLLCSQDSEGVPLLYVLSRHYRGKPAIYCEMSVGKLVVALWMNLFSVSLAKNILNTTLKIFTVFNFKSN
jgi:hypothetical protein